MEILNQLKAKTFASFNLSFVIIVLHFTLPCLLNGHGSPYNSILNSSEEKISNYSVLLMIQVAHVLCPQFKVTNLVA